MTAKYILTCAIAMLALTGCGGGGSASTPTTPIVSTCSNGATDYPTCTPPASTQWEPVVTSVPAATYSGESLAGFDLLNQRRSAAGVGLLAQNSHLDASSANHMNYLLNNLTETGSFHTEIVGHTGFTGETVQARVVGAGYVGGAGEVGVDYLLRAGTGQFCLHNLIDDSVYHRLDILGNWTDVGVAVGTNAAGETICVVNVGNRTGLNAGQVPANPVTYPYANQTDVDTTFVPASEIPNPAPDLGTALIGLPVTVSLASQNFLGSNLLSNLVGFQASDVTVSAFTLTAQGSSTPVVARLLTAAGVLAGPGVVLTIDAHQSPQWAFTMLPLTQLAPNTVYNAVFTATVKGAPVSLHWSFTTGTGNP
jgi:uncharacterized protein YkwD